MSTPEAKRAKRAAAADRRNVVADRAAEAERLRLLGIAEAAEQARRKSVAEMFEELTDELHDYRDEHGADAVLVLRARDRKIRLTKIGYCLVVHLGGAGATIEEMAAVLSVSDADMRWCHLMIECRFWKSCCVPELRDEMLALEATEGLGLIEDDSMPATPEPRALSFHSDHHKEDTAALMREPKTRGRY